MTDPTPHPTIPTLILVSQADRPHQDDNGDPIIIPTLRVYVDPRTDKLTILAALIGVANEMLNPS